MCAAGIRSSIAGCGAGCGRFRSGETEPGKQERAAADAGLPAVAGRDDAVTARMGSEVTVRLWMGAIGEKLGVGHAAFTRRRMAAARIATQSVGCSTRSPALHGLSRLEDRRKPTSIETGALQRT
jgi:hypothetical protein